MWSGGAAETQDTSNYPSACPDGCDACRHPVLVPEAGLNRAAAALVSGRDPVAPWQDRGGQVPPAVRLSYTMDRRHSAPTDGLGMHDRSGALPRFRPARGSRKARVRMRTHSCLKWNPECCPRHLPPQRRLYALILRTFVGFSDAERTLEGDSTRVPVERPAM